MALLESDMRLCDIKSGGDCARLGRPVTIWLFVLAGMAAGMVLLGGLTRLTGSGLSMVHWQPATLLPPIGHQAWEAAFADYRASPQFRLVNSGMDLAGFQHIFWLEYLHRLWGRLVGVAALLPLAAFWACGRIDRRLARRLLVLVALGGVQGLLGWLMLASGLVDRPAVSPFRLAAHLVMGFLLFGGLLWTALDTLPPPVPAGRAGAGRVVAILVLLLVTVTWGALTAGTHAGLVYETFPLMDGRLLPADGLDPLRDLGAIQLAHRLLAVSTVLGLSGLWLARRRLVPAARRPLSFAAAWAWCQAGLGISTLLLAVPLSLAAAHQMGALTLFGLVVWTLHRSAAALR